MVLFMGVALACTPYFYFIYKESLLGKSRANREQENSNTIILIDVTEVRVHVKVVPIIGLN